MFSHSPSNMRALNEALNPGALKPLNIFSLFRPCVSPKPQNLSGMPKSYSLRFTLNPSIPKCLEAETFERKHQLYSLLLERYENEGPSFDPNTYVKP